MKSIDFPKSYKNLPRASHTHLSNIPSLIKCYGGSIDITYRCVESELNTNIFVTPWASLNF